MKKTLAVLATVGALAATAAAPTPAEAFWRGGGWRGGGFGWGPGLAFGLAAGALTAGAIASSYGPYGYYGPGYGSGYYGPGYGYGYYRPTYAYYRPYGYGRPYWRQRYWGGYW